VLVLCHQQLLLVLELVLLLVVSSGSCSAAGQAGVVDYARGVIAGMVCSFKHPQVRTSTARVL
jgi:hypothetical protein